MVHYSLCILASMVICILFTCWFTEASSPNPAGFLLLDFAVRSLRVLKPHSSHFFLLNLDLFRPD